MNLTLHARMMFRFNRKKKTRGCFTYKAYMVFLYLQVKIEQHVTQNRIAIKPVKMIPLQRLRVTVLTNL